MTAEQRKVMIGYQGPYMYEDGKIHWANISRVMVCYTSVLKFTSTNFNFILLAHSGTTTTLSLHCE